MSDVFEELGHKIKVKDEKIQISSEDKGQKVQRTFYIHSKTDEMLEYYKKKTGKTKSELAEISFRYFFKNAEID